MKRKYLFIGGFVIAVVLIAVSVLKWNTEVETTTKKAKEDIKIAEEKKEATNPNGEASEGTDGQGTAGTQNGTNHVTTVPKTAALNGQSQTGVSNPNDPNQSAGVTAAGSDGTLIEGSGSDASTDPSRFKGTSLNDIKSAYRTIFSDLEIQEMSRVDQLMVQAKADYVSGKLTKSDLAAKYQDAAVALERNADQTFNSIYNQMQIDLGKYGHSPSEAVEFRSEYQTKKQERMTHVINELQNF